MDLDLQRDRETILRTVEDFHRRYHNDTMYDQIWDESNEIVARWAEAGRVGELLTPLLDSDSTRVRYTAAVGLLRYAPSERVWEVLADIHARRVRDDSFYKVEAGMLLREAGRLE